MQGFRLFAVERVVDAAPTLFIVDDDLDLCALMTDFFVQHGYRTECSHNGRDALARLLAGKHDLVILDVMLPVIDGFDILRQIRKTSVVPIIMLTARTSGADRVSGLNSGADDYLPKPFEPEELLARIRAVLRRIGRTDTVAYPPLQFGGLQLNPRTREISLNGDPVAITGIEFDILEYLMRSAGRIVSRDALAAILYQREATPFERSIDVHICHLRRKLQHRGGPVIRTIRGAGYLFAQRVGRET